MRLIVAAADSQNGNKALCHLEIGENRGKTRGWPAVGLPSANRFPRDFLGKALDIAGWMRQQMNASGPKSAEMGQTQR